MNFCTLFDSEYLTRGLSLVASLLEQSRGSRLWVLCMDEETVDVVRALCPPQVVAVPFNVVEDGKLRRARAERSKVEFLWTCTPVVCDYVLRANPALDHLVYVDADVMFFDDPMRLLGELGDGSVLVFEHGFPRARQHVAECMGRFNVEVIVFRRSQPALDCVSWWRDRCIEWCYHRVEKGRMGDQKYLDRWPELFQGVVVAGPGVLGLAPWNFETWSLSEGRDGALIANGHPVLFVHFSKLSMFGRGEYQRCAGYTIPGLVDRLAYDRYMAELDRQWDRVLAIRPSFRAGLLSRPRRRWWAEARDEVARRIPRSVRESPMWTRPVGFCRRLLRGME